MPRIGQLASNCCSASKGKSPSIRVTTTRPKETVLTKRYNRKKKIRAYALANNINYTAAMRHLDSLRDMRAALPHPENQEDRRAQLVDLTSDEAGRRDEAEVPAVRDYISARSRGLDRLPESLSEPGPTASAESGLVDNSIRIGFSDENGNDIEYCDTSRGDERADLPDADYAVARAIDRARTAERVPSTVRKLEHLLRLSVDDCDWLTEKFEAGASVRTTVSATCVMGAYDEDADESQLVGGMNVFVTECEEDGFWRELGSFNLDAEWPTTGGRDSDLDRLSCDIDMAVSAAAAKAGFSLWNAGVEDGSGSGYFSRTYELGPL